jgi:hypothetical protein
VRQAEAQLFARDDGGAHLAEVLVAPGVVAMQVGVDDELDRLRRQLLDGGGDLVAERRELRVHHEHAVGADQHADRPALPLQRVELVGDLVRLDFHLAEVLPALRGCDGGAEDRCAERKEESNGSHDCDLHRKQTEARRRDFPGSVRPVWPGAYISCPDAAMHRSRVGETTRALPCLAVIVRP